jgi:cyclohexyl-isocyanide hydratase
MSLEQDPKNSTLSRRELMSLAAGAASLAVASSVLGAQQGPPAQSHEGHGNHGEGHGAHGDHDHGKMMKSLPKIRFGLLLFPELTALDLVGPQLLMATMMNTEVHLVWKSKDPVMCDSGFAIVPTTTFAECPRELDVLCVPGGPRGTHKALLDNEVIDFVAETGSRAKYVTSVCTGSLILGAAGLLKGYKAASYWTVRDVLPLLGAEPVNRRVVIDRNRITGGGITAGIDFGLVLSSILRGEDTARLQELVLEYTPEPPFKAGSAEAAKPETVKLARMLLKEVSDAMRDAATQAYARHKA